MRKHSCFYAVTQVLPHTLVTHISMSKGSCSAGILLPSHTALCLETQQKPKPSNSIRSKLSEESLRLGRSDPTSKPVSWQAVDCRSNPAPQLPLSYSHIPVCAVAKVARCKAKGQKQNHPLKQPPTINHIELHPQHAHFTK